jgi:L-fuconolactonase
MKIDAHQHFWNLEKLAYPWLSPDATVLYRNFTPADLAPELAACGIDGTVFVQATHAEVEIDWVFELARENPFIKGVVGWLDITAPDLGEKLAAYRAKGPLCGIRHQVHDEPDPRWLLRPDVIDGLKLLAKQDVTFDLLLRPVHLPFIPELLRAVPDGHWVIDHISKPEIKDGKIEPWFQDLRRVAEFPNVYCKISGMITEADHANWTIENIRPYFERVLEMFGPKRLLYGSDWPVCLLAGSYRQVYELAAALTASLSQDEQAAFWGGTAQQVYKLA